MKEREEPPRRGRLARVLAGTRGYARRRALGDAVSIGGRGLRELAREAGLSRRAGAGDQVDYADGGLEAFALRAEAEGLDDGALERLLSHHRAAAALFALLALLAVIAGVYSMVTAASLLDSLAGATCLVLAAALGAKAFQADLSRWQIAQRRFAPPAEYLASRWLPARRKKGGRHLG